MVEDFFFFLPNCHVWDLTSNEIIKIKCNIKFGLKNVTNHIICTRIHTIACKKQSKNQIFLFMKIQTIPNPPQPQTDKHNPTYTQYNKLLNNKHKNTTQLIHGRKKKKKLFFVYLFWGPLVMWWAKLVKKEEKKSVLWAHL